MSVLAIVRSSLILMCFVCCTGAIAQPAGGARGQTGSAVSVREATEAFRAGTAAFQAGDLARAQSLFERAVKLAPKISAAHGALGAVLLARGDGPGAVRELGRAHELEPGARATTVNLAVADAVVKNFNGSAALYRELEMQEPDAVDVLARETSVPLATALSATGDQPAALRLLERAVRASPEDAPLADALGTVQAVGGAFDAAEVTLRRAVALDPSLAAARYHLGAVLLETHRADAAVGELREAHRLEPANGAYAVELAGALGQAGKDDEAVGVLQGTLAAWGAGSEGMTEVRYRLALALQTQERVKEALPLFDAVVAARPRDAEALTNAGLDHVQMGDARGGIALYQRALREGSGSATLHEDLGVAYLQQADLTRAIEEFRAGLALDAASPQLHYDLGLALKLKDDLAGAVPEFERAAELDPDLPDPPYTLGVIYMQQGRFADAARRLERATELRPNNGDAWATLGSVYKQSDENDKAVTALRRAILLLPQQPSPHITLAAILSAEGKKDEAAAERKLGADLTRKAVSRQKADFGIDSGKVLLEKGKTAEALAQFDDAVAADPGYGAAHMARAGGLDRAGRKAEAAEERRKAAALGDAK